MVHDSYDDIDEEQIEPQQQGSDFVDTASDLKDIYDSYSNQDKSLGKNDVSDEQKDAYLNKNELPENQVSGDASGLKQASPDSSGTDEFKNRSDLGKSTEESASPYDKSGLEKADQGKSSSDLDTGKDAYGKSDDFNPTKAEPGRLKRLGAQQLGGEIGAEVGRGGAEALGGDETQQKIGEEGGRLGGGYAGGKIYDKFAGQGAQAPSTGGVGTGGAGTGAGGAGTGAAGAGGTGAGALGGTGAAGTVGTGAAGTAGAAGTGAGAAGGAGVAGAAGGAGAGAAAGGAAGSAAAAGGAVAAEGGAAAGGGIIAAVGWPVILIVLAIVIIIIIIFIIIAIVAPRLSFDKNDPANQQTISRIESSIASNHLILANKNEDMEKIRNGEIGKGALETIANLSGNHEQISIHYTGIREYAPGTTKANDSFEFDITSADKIKCTDTATNTRLVEFPLYLNLNYNWQSLALSSYSDSVLCAVGYYPKIDPVIGSDYRNLYSPEEFPIQDLPQKAKMAVQEKTAEIIAEIISQDRLYGIDSQSPDSLLPVKINYDGAMASQNFKSKGTDGIASALQKTINQAYSKLYPDGNFQVLEPINNYVGIHISYL